MVLRCDDETTRVEGLVTNLRRVTSTQVEIFTLTHVPLGVVTVTVVVMSSNRGTRFRVTVCT